MIKENIRRALADEDMLPQAESGEERHILCALSGGADSAAMTDALADLAPELNIKISAVHVNHCLRGEDSERDERFVRSFCERRAITLYAGRFDVASLARERRRGIEETARDVRYAFLEQTASEIGAGFIATAHNMDDNLETMLLALCRGTGGAGLCGIPPARSTAGSAVRIIRPLLFTLRAEIEEYLAARGIEYVTDTTNFSRDYSRNRLRLDVLPVLREINPRVARHAAQAARFLREDMRELDGQAQSVHDALVQMREGYVAFPASRLTELGDAVGTRVLRALHAEACRRTGREPLPPDAKSVRRMRELAANKNPSACTGLPGGLAAWREYELLCVGDEPRDMHIAERTLKIPGMTRLDEAKVNIYIENGVKSEKTANGFHSLYVDSSRIHGILSVRARREGDMLHLPGRHSRSLKKLFIEKSIPRRIRGLVPVICDGENIVAVPGFGVDRRYANPAGKCLIMHFVPADKENNPDNEK